MKIAFYIFETIVLLILAVINALVLYGLVHHICFTNDAGTVMAKLSLYKWAALGASVYTILHIFIHKNIKWLETFSHEMTHVVVSLLFLRDIRAMNVRSEGGGEAITAGKAFASAPISLAPYCLPLFTYILLFLRPLISEEPTPMMIFDTLIGLSIGFHAHCFASQTRPYQTDITRYGIFSVFYILTFLLFNANTIIVSFWQHQNVFTAFWYVIKQNFTTFLSFL